MSGWMSTLSWQAGTAGGAFLFGTLIQGTVVAYRPEYQPKPFHGTLMAIAISLTEGAFNIWALKWLPKMQEIIAFPHALGWIAVIGVLAALAPHASAKEVFLDFTSEGWQPIGLSLMVGQISSVYSLICMPFPRRVECQ